ncbi:MAG: methyltransferase, partial [Pseudomonadota bacterium]
MPPAAERSTYVLFSSLALILLFALWEPMGGVVWTLSASWAIAAAYGLYAIGWLLVLYSTFAINHFDLFGLRQVNIHFKDQPRPPLNFVKRAMYKYIRHPIQSGVMIGIWATPLMTHTQIILSLGFTAYIFIGLWFD